MGIHVRTLTDELAPLVLLPGDPGRAKMIAENYLENAKLTTSYRSMFGYTGTYKGKRVSVQTTGMGGPSTAIVCEELCDLGAKFLLRIGTCGALSDDLPHGRVIVAQGAYNCDAVPGKIFGSDSICCVSDFEFMLKVWQKSKELDIPVNFGTVASLDLFYSNSPVSKERLREFGVIGVEMEAATIMTVAAKRHIRASAMCTVSDIVASLDRAHDDVILKGAQDMVKVALESLVALEL